jgi:hypothetical protein
LEIPAVLSVVKERIRSSQCAVILDIDETILSLLGKWTEHIKLRMKLDNLTVQQIRDCGGLENFFRSSPRYNEFKEIHGIMRESGEFHSDLAIVEGALVGVQKLLEIPGLSIGCYLTTRPFHITFISEIDIQAKGFPVVPVIARPDHVPRESTAQWKLSILEELQRNYEGVLILVDDRIPIAKAIRERNRESSTAIVAIVLSAPVSRANIMREGIVTCSSEHVYVADWEGIPRICSEYARTQAGADD